MFGTRVKILQKLIFSSLHRLKKNIHPVAALPYEWEVVAKLVWTDNSNLNNHSLQPFIGLWVQGGDQHWAVANAPQGTHPKGPI